MRRSMARSYSAKAPRRRRLHVDDADQPAAGDHGDGEFAADDVGGAEVPRVGAYIGHEDRLAMRRGRAHDAFTER